MSAELYRIKNWNTHFETAQSRRYKSLGWVAVPNKHDGKGFRRLMRRQNREALLGCWLLIVQVASKCPIRGTLCDIDGPLSEHDLSDKTGARAATVRQTLETLSELEIGWLEKIQWTDEIAAKCVRAESAIGADSEHARSTHTIQNRTVQNRTNKEKKRPKAEKLVSFPGELNTPAFAAAWANWLKHRTEKRAGLTPSAQAAVLKKFAVIGAGRAVAAIQFSIEQGYTGCFEPKGNGGGANAKATQQPADGLSVTETLELQRAQALLKEHRT